jgi:beta-lactamase superfamily II metal-dependent hydrolase
MEVIFKNVGHGDSVILFWDSNTGKKYCGIIDCNRFYGKNPVIDHLKQVSDEIEIDFMILSHPHSDHFSGYLELLEYCELESIQINKFLNTWVQPKSYLSWCVKDDKEGELFNKIIKKIIALRKSGNILEWDEIMSKSIIPLKNIDKQLKIHSPSGDEKGQFINQLEERLLNEEPTRSMTSPLANYMCSVIELQDNSSNSSIILSSDATKFTLQRIASLPQESGIKNSISLVQIPHHGSIKNHYEPFWEKLSSNHRCPSVISAGKNSYNHPHYNVLEWFENNGYKFHITNLVNGASEYIYRRTEVELKKSKALDSISTLTKPPLHTKGSDVSIIWDSKSGDCIVQHI